MLLISTDGACRNIGTPECTSAGSAFIQELHNDADNGGALTVFKTSSISNFEEGSTSQRGELMGMLCALRYTLKRKKMTHIVTDSEYVYNTLTREWYKAWLNSGWITRGGTEVKNLDLWLQVVEAYEECLDEHIDLTLNHIKGHCIPFGAVTATKLFNEDKTGKALLEAVYKKYDAHSSDKYLARLKHANDVHFKNNGFKLLDATLRTFVSANVVVDLVANIYLEKQMSLLGSI